MDRVTEGDGTMELPFEDSKKRHGVDTRRLAEKTCRDRQTQEAVGDGASERAVLGRRVIDMERIKVTCETSEQHDIGFRQRSARALPLIAHSEIVEAQNCYTVAGHVRGAGTY